MKLMHRNRLAAAIALSWLGAAGTAAQAQVIDLGNLGSAGFRIDGGDAGDYSGRSVSGAGDVNGDGLGDLIVGAFGADPGGDSSAGESYVVFGKSSTTPVDLAALGSGGFRIDGINVDDSSGRSVSGAGDVNGDGLADLIVGADAADPGGDSLAGESYVVFGKASTTPVDLAALGSGGFRIDGIDDSDRSGVSVAGAGDVNGDGLADLIVGANQADPGGDSRAGESYVVFGKSSNTPIDLAALGSAGFRIDGIDADDFSGGSVSGAGDVNGDGLADLIVGAFQADPGGDSQAGESYVVFGKAGTTPVDLAALGSGGFRIDGIDASDYSGRSVSGAGDVNGDGLADLIVGALGADSGAGESYVVFGKSSTTPVDLAALGSAGFRIDGKAADKLGRSVSGAGDVNGDGLADLIVGAYQADPGGDLGAGESYVVFGKTSSAPVDLAALGSGGIRIDGIDALDNSGISVSAAGDVNGDGLADLIVGAIGADPGGDPNAGESYVLFSPSVPPLSASYRARSANGDPPRTAIAIVGDGSDDSHPAARTWIDFADGADPVLAASTETVTLTRTAGAFSPAAANVHWQIQSTRENWSSAEVRFRYLDSELTLGDEQALQLVFSSNGAAPFTPLTSVVNPQDNTISANTSQPGFLYLGDSTIDLGNLGSGGFRIDGIDPTDRSGFSVSGAGDVNGDGLADLIVGAQGADFYAGRSYVVYGKASTTLVDLAALGSAGFRIDGVDVADRSGGSVSGAGDVNGDGLADLIVGAYSADPGGDSRAGESYVVFGKVSTTPIDLAALGSGGFRIDGIDTVDRSGRSVSGAGDVNGDGLADLIVGARGGDPGGDASAGESYVVFGKASTTPVDLATLGSGGFRIDGIDPNDQSGGSVSGAGDVNGDGLADLIIGAYQADPGGDSSAGESYVVFGKASTMPVDLAALGSGGFRIDGIDPADVSGRSVSGAGDVNGDGLADLIVGAAGADPGGDLSAGESYVVFGKATATPVDLAALGSAGFRIDGIDASDRSGRSVAGAGDVNGDGLADLIVGAYSADPGGDSRAGESYVVYGKASTTLVDLAALGSAGFRIDGVDASDRSGVSVSGAGDVNGDGLADLIVGAYGADADAGESYVVFSPSIAPLSASYRARSGNGDPPRTAIAIVGDGSDDSHPAARAWIDFADGNDPVLAASTETVTLTRAAGAFSPGAANIHWQIQSTRGNWTSAEVRFRYLDSELTIGNENALQLVFSADGAAPFTPLTSVVNPQDNTISTNISQPGFLYLGERILPPLIYTDGFE